MGDRYPVSQATYPAPPPRNNGGGDGAGGPPHRDRRRSRSLGADLAVGASPAAFTGSQSSMATTTGQLCTYDTGPDEGGEEAQTLMAFLKAYDFAENAVTGLRAGATDPFAAVTWSGSPSPDFVKQSLEVFASLQWGVDGVTKKVLMNLPAGQIVKCGLAATYARAHAKLTAKYLPRIQLANLPGAVGGPTQQFTYLDADPNVRNNVWNSIDSPALYPLAGFDRDSAPTTPIHVDGILSIGAASVGFGGSSDRSSRATRRFYGTFPVQGAAYNPGVGGGGAIVLCPIAFGASAVMLQANPTAFTQFTAGAAIRGPLTFGMIDHAGNVVAQQPVNLFVPLIANCQSIFVYNTGVNAAENPFALVYDLGL